MSDKSTDTSKTGEAIEPEQLDAALSHIGALIHTDGIAASAAKGLLYSLIETLGVLVGDPDLPAHVRSGYEGLLETAQELRAKLER